MQCNVSAVCLIHSHFIKSFSEWYNNLGEIIYIITIRNPALKCLFPLLVQYVFDSVGVCCVYLFLHVPHVCANKALPWIALQCSGWRDTDNENLPAPLPFCSVGLFLHQGQQHLPALSHCSHGNASKTEAGRGGENKPEILCYCTVALFIVPLLFSAVTVSPVTHLFPLLLEVTTKVERTV